MHSTDAITDISLEWLRNGRDPDRPFFRMHHYKAPHDMFVNAPRYDDDLADVAVLPKSQGYHYNRNAETYMLVGDALGRAMLKLQSGRDR